MPIDDRTSTQNYPKPNIANTLADDVGRLRTALDDIDTGMASKAPAASPVFTGTAGIPLGSASAPSLYFTGDPNTGLYSPGADQVAITTGGTGRLFVDASGNVGIGTTSPVTPNSGGSITANGTLSARGYLADHQTSTGVLQYNDNVLALRAYGATSGTGVIAFNTGGGGNTTDTERLRITSDGKVGIGLSSPNTSLEVNGIITALSGAFDAGGYKFTYAGSVDSRSWWLANDVAAYGDFSIRQSTTQTGSTYASRFHIAPDGNVGIGTSSPGSLLEVSGSGSATEIRLRSTDTTNTTIRSYVNSLEAGKLAFTSGRELFIETAGTERARIDSSGKVGIGTSSPSSLIEVLSDGDAILTLTGNVASGTNVAAVDFKRNGGTVNASIRSQSAVANDAGEIYFSTRPVSGSLTERVRIDRDGKVGIGTGSPGALFHCETASSELIRANSTAAGGGYIAVQSSGTNIIYIGSGASLSAALSTDGTIRANNNLTFATGGGTERARIDSSGRLLVGVSANISAFGSGFQLVGSGAEATQLIMRNTTAVGGPQFYFAKSRGSNASPLVVIADDELGLIDFRGYSATGAAYPQAASIQAFVDGTPDSGGDTTDMPGRLVFSTTADGSSIPTEAMRINNQRELLIGTTTRTANGGVLQISNGITFPGTQSACSDANTLDDYEEGTWTPTIIGTSVAGIGTYAAQQAKYTKIGRIVYIQARIDWTAHTGTGAMRISGLPFAVSSSASTPAISIIPDRMTSPASTFPQAYALNSTSDIVIVSTTIAGGGEANLAMDTDAGIRVGGWYEV